MYFRNLKRASIQLLKSRSFKQFINDLDRLGNALCAGDYRATVSGRVGFHALKLQIYWVVLEWIIDQTFRPIDGENHCYNVFLSERRRGIDHRRGNDIALTALSVLVIAACLLLAPVLYVAGRIKDATALHP